MIWGVVSRTLHLKQAPSRKAQMRIFQKGMGLHSYLLSFPWLSTYSFAIEIWQIPMNIHIFQFISMLCLTLFLVSIVWYIVFYSYCCLSCSSIDPYSCFCYDSIVVLTPCFMRVVCQHNHLFLISVSCCIMLWISDCKAVVSFRLNFLLLLLTKDNSDYKAWRLLPHPVCQLVTQVHSIFFLNCFIVVVSVLVICSFS